MKQLWHSRSIAVAKYPSNILKQVNEYDSKKVEEEEKQKMRKIVLSKEKERYVKENVSLPPICEKLKNERVYDVLNGDYIKHNEREIIERQLKHINLYNYKKPKELLKGDKSDNSFNDEVIEEKIKGEKSPVKDTKKSKNIKNIYGPSNIYYEIRNNRK